MITETPYRMERKYLLSPQASMEVEGRVRTHPFGFRIQYPDREVNNLYFDTDHFEFLAYHLQGIAERKKVRVRWYGPQHSPKEANQLTLEEKVKRGITGYKRQQSISWEQLINMPLDGLHPTLRNGYKRSYFQIHHGEIRLTIDRDIWFTLPQQPKSHVFRLEGSIIELKYPHEQEKTAAQICQFFPWRITRSSKYVTGCQYFYQA